MPIKRTFNRSTPTYEEAISKFNRADKTTSKTPRNHPEDDLQEICVKWFDLTYPKLRLLLHHSPNGGKRNAREAGRFKLMGVRAGFPDLQLLIANRGYFGLFVELKAGKGRQSEAQKAYQVILEHDNYKYVICRTPEEFSREINGYLE